MGQSKILKVHGYFGRFQGLNTKKMSIQIYNKIIYYSNKYKIQNINNLQQINKTMVNRMISSIRNRIWALDS